MSQPKKRVAVFGGRSSEHAISCVTAGSVLKAIDRTAYDVVPIGIATDGRWVLESGDPETLQITGPDKVFPEVDGGLAAVTLARLRHRPGRARATVPPQTLGEVDVVFPVLPARGARTAPSRGCSRWPGSATSARARLCAVSMDKGMKAVVLAAAGLPVMRSIGHGARVVPRPDGITHRTAARLPGVRQACPRRLLDRHLQGPTTRLADAVEEYHRHDPALIEVAAEGAREIECGVLQALDGTPETSLPAEIRITGDHEFYDFAAKYLPRSTPSLDVPANLPDDVATSLRDLAARAFEAVGCEGLARVDFFVFPDGSLVVNEINTMPGFTPLSMFPRMWAATGLDYPALVDRLITLALNRSTGLR